MCCENGDRHTLCHRFGPIAARSEQCPQWIGPASGPDDGDRAARPVHQFTGRGRLGRDARIERRHVAHVRQAQGGAGPRGLERRPAHRGERGGRAVDADHDRQRQRALAGRRLQRSGLVQRGQGAQRVQLSPRALRVQAPVPVGARLRRCPADHVLVMAPSCLSQAWSRSAARLPFPGCGQDGQYGVRDVPQCLRGQTGLAYRLDTANHR